MTYARRVDSNHAEIVAAMRSMGAVVIDCSHVGDGFPDLLVGWRGVTHLVEIKDGAKSASRRKLTTHQVLFHAEWTQRGGPLHVVKSVDEALAILGARRAA